MAETPDIAQARPEEFAPAFRLIFQHVGPSQRETRVANAVALVEQGEFDPRGLFVARGGDALLGSLICLPVPGAAGLVWPPAAIVGRRDIEDALVRRATEWLRASGAKLAQSLLAPNEAYLAAPLERNGFAHITSLWFLKHDLTSPRPVPPRRLEVQSYQFGDRDLFHHTLMRTYEGTLDCPEVNGVREPAEIVAGHQSQGAFDPERWLLAFDEGKPAAVLLLTDLRECDGWDLSYLGVIPDARGRGVGRELTRLAIQMARQAGAAQLTLSVNTRNRPAWNLYTGLGFEPFDQREVYLSIWDRPADSSCHPLH